MFSFTVAESKQIMTMDCDVTGAYHFKLKTFLTGTSPCLSPETPRCVVNKDGATLIAIGLTD